MTEPQAKIKKIKGPYKLKTRVRRLMDLEDMAEFLGVPEHWLKEEAAAGRIPFLGAGDVLLFHPDSLEKVLTAQLMAKAEAVLTHLSGRSAKGGG